MFLTNLRRFWVGGLLLLAIAVPAQAENEGQDDLDQATQLKISAEGIDDLNDVVDKLETALEKGLDEGNTEFAKQLLAASLLQRATALSGVLLNGQQPADVRRDPRFMQLRQLAINDLQHAVEVDKQALDAYMLIGRLQMLAPGDPNAARRALTQVVDNKDATPEQVAEALALRSATQKDEEKQVADLNRAVELQPEKPDYLRIRAQYLYGKEDSDAALADVDAALKLDPEHAGTHELRGMVLLGLERYDDALACFDKATTLAPEAALPYQHRGEVYRQKGDMDKAIEQLSKAIELSPENVATLLVRANIYTQLKKNELAIADVEKVVQLQPQLLVAHLMRAELYASTDRMNEAIAQLEKLVKIAPDQAQLLSQLGTFYLVDKKPQKAIETFTSVINKDPQDYRALRFRGDAYLNMGKHKEAIADFESALKLQDDEDGLLNNFAWVLATSPVDELRDGAKAVKLATKACEQSGYETPHILSTLAAAYAETGDFETAIKWSSKSVEVAQKEIDDAKDDAEREKAKADREQLEKELAGYKEGKQVREMQTVEEASDTPPPTDQAVTPAATPAPAGTDDSDARAER